MEQLAILGIGSALPDRTVGNLELEALTGFAASRIHELFEIEERRWSRGVETADPPIGQRCSDLAISAARAALRDAGVAAREISAIIAVTTTPDFLNPPIDFLIAQGLDLLGVPAFSLQAPCTGVFRAVELASALASRNGQRPILITAADTPSPFFRFGEGVATDQVMNSLLYADGAGALVVVPSSEKGGRRIEAVDLQLNSETTSSGITFPGMLSAYPPSVERYESTDYLGHHDFQRVLRRGSKLAAGAALRLMEQRKLTASEVRFFLTHQATGNIRRIGASYGLPPEKIPLNIQRVGNTISASVLILLDELARENAIAKGDLLILHTAESSTWSSAAMAIRW